MKIEDQVCSLELAKKLKELGVKQDSCFYWLPKLLDDLNPSIGMQGSFNVVYHHDTISAFTLTELFNLIPRYISREDDPLGGYRLQFHKSVWATNRIIIDNYIVRYESDILYPEPPIRVLHVSYDANPSNAIAKALIYLLENGYIKND